MRVYIFFDFGEATGSELDRLVEGEIRVIRCSVLLQRLLQTNRVLLHTLETLVHFYEGLVFLTLTDTVFAVI